MEKLNLWLAAKGINEFELKKVLIKSNQEDVILTGSLLAGYGDENSDVDVYKIIADEYYEQITASADNERKFQQKRQKCTINYIDFKGVEFDVEIHPASKINMLIDEFAEVDVDSEQGIIESFDGLRSFEVAETIDLLNRLSIGHHLSGESLISEKIKSISRTKLAKWMSERRFIDSKDFGKTFKRNLNKKEYLNAYIALTHRIDAAVDYVLFAEGILFDRWKWRSKMVNSSKNKKMITAYYEVHVCSNINKLHLMHLNKMIDDLVENNNKMQE